MPELPEVETVVRSIRPHVEGHVIRSAELFSKRVTRGGIDQTERALAGRRIFAVNRRGKQILMDTRPGIVYVHLGMTGRLLWNASPGKHTRAIFNLDNGTLLYDDSRMFGRVEFCNEQPVTGPDALAISADEFCARLKRRQGRVKSLLLNQAFVAGIGNIYADEALFAARIHPLSSPGRLSDQRSSRLYAAVQETLRLAIEHRGSSISDYVDARGERGGFQHLHNVYGRDGQPCPRCGTLIRRIVVAQRGTHYCPRCQRA